MNAISKNVVAGFLFGFGLTLFASCSPDFSFSPDSDGSVVVSVSIPSSLGESELPPALKEALALSSGSRFIHPDTRRIEASVAIGGNRGKTLRASASVASGAASATLTVRKVPLGDHTLTVSLYDASGILLSRGSSPVTVTSRGAANADVSAIPITKRTFLPGPYGDRGTLISAENAGQIMVYYVEVPQSGSYKLRCFGGKDLLSVDDAALYGADGRRISTVRGGSGSSSGEYGFIHAGTCYAVIDVPESTTNDIQLSLDSDTRISMNAETVYVDSDLTVMDYTRPFSLNVPCGYSGEFSVDWSSAEGSGTITLTPTDTKTITVQPGANGLRSYSTNAPGSSLWFTDALLGISRQIGFRFAGAPRTFVYCNSSGTLPADSSALAAQTWNEAVTTVNDDLADSNAAVIALHDGESFANSACAINYGVLALGGFALDGTRPAGHGSNTITLSGNAYNLSIIGDGSHFDSLNWIIPGGTITATNCYPISVGGTSEFRNCAFGFSSALTLNLATQVIYSILYISSDDATFERCSVKGPNVLFSLGGSHILYALNDVASASCFLKVENCVICPGTLTNNSTANQTMCGIYLSATSYGTLYVAGSSVSSGLTDGSVAYAPVMRPVQMSPSITNTINIANSLLVSGYPDHANGAFVYSGNTINFNFHNNYLAYTTSGISDSAYIIYLGSGAGTRITFDNWSTYYPDPISSAASLSLLSAAVSSEDFLRPQASSPSALRTGGGDLSVSSVRTTLCVPASDADYLVMDRDGTPRTGNGATGYSIGAYETD